MTKLTKISGGYKRMTARAATCILAIFLVALSVSCQSAKVLLGLEEAPPPVTDAQYFNSRMEMVILSLDSNKSKSIRKAAVLNFTNSDGQVSELGRYLTLKFREAALTSKSFRVSPSGQIDETLTLLKITNPESLTLEQAQQIGAALDADAVITGVVADLQKGADVDLNVKAVSASSGDLISAASVPIYRSKQVQTLIQQIR